MWVVYISGEVISAEISIVPDIWDYSRLQASSTVILLLLSASSLRDSVIARR